MAWVDAVQMVDESSAKLIDRPLMVLLLETSRTNVSLSITRTA